jgi:hypothetical protein
MNANQIAAFGYYLESLFKQLTVMFPNCIVTGYLASHITKATLSNDRSDLMKIIADWKKNMGTAEMHQAVHSGDIENLLKFENPTIEMLQLKQKISDPIMTPKSKETLLQFVKTLHGIVFPSENNSEPTGQSGSELVQASPPPVRKPSNFPSSSVDELLNSVPQELNPLFDLARNFIQKLPEDDVQALMGNITNIGRTVMNNMDRDNTSVDFGGDFFQEILTRTFLNNKK